MLFTTFSFVGFLLVVLLLFYSLPNRFRRYLLLTASLLFYMAWNAKFVVLILGLITVDYFAARWIGTRPGPQKHMALVASLAANIGLLGWFKYANFAREIWINILHPGVAIQPWNIILPLGISFHTFQSISYVIDVYRGDQAVVASYTDYALFVAFFPQLVAGPIVRAGEFFHDLRNWKAPTGKEWQQGIQEILTGYVKKLVLADQFAMLADSYFANPAALPGLMPAWTGAIAFALQIYFDFSGYTDIAIGVARLLGFHFPQNFRRPYLSASVNEFWRRWHMTLSRWLRDYVYIPLGGNRKGPFRTYLNLILTMLLGGLWHGANWNFVMWGGYHGALLAVERIVWDRNERMGLLRIPFMILTFLLICVGWVFFRAKTVATAWFVIVQMVSRAPGQSLISAPQWLLAALTLAIALAEEYCGMLTRLTESPVWVRTLTAVAVLLVIELFSATEQTVPFVYFQF